MTRKRSLTKPTASSLSWLPIDSRLIPQVFAFGHVRGLAKLFLALEMILAGFVVTGTIALMVLSIFS